MSTRKSLKSIIMKNQIDEIYHHFYPETFYVVNKLRLLPDGLLSDLVAMMAESIECVVPHGGIRGKGLHDTNLKYGILY